MSRQGTALRRLTTTQRRVDWEQEDKAVSEAQSIVSLLPRRRADNGFHARIRLVMALYCAFAAAAAADSSWRYPHCIVAEDVCLSGYLIGIAK